MLDHVESFLLVVVYQAVLSAQSPQSFMVEHDEFPYLTPFIIPLFWITVVDGLFPTNFVKKKTMCCLNPHVVGPSCKQHVDKLFF